MTTRSEPTVGASELLQPHPERVTSPVAHFGSARLHQFHRVVSHVEEAPAARPRPFSWLDTAHMLGLRTELPGRATRIGVRTFDIVLASVGLVVAAPLMLVLALVVRATTHGPAFFVHWRVGRAGRLFPCLKFRSMWADAPARLEEVLAGDSALREEWRTTQKLRNDPRVTPIGAFLRRTNLDELPQILNVLIGQMSIVGPRPVTPAETERYGHRITTVLSVKPGLTGLWQVSGRSDLCYATRVELDVEYVERRTFVTDLVICAKTAYAMIHPSTDGAY